VGQFCAPSGHAHSRLLNIVAQHRVETIARCYVNMHPNFRFQQKLDANQFEQ
jgi:hypothetical protein